MTTTTAITLLAFDVELKDGRTGERSTDVCVIDREAVRRCECYGMDGPALVCRMYNIRGYRVLDIKGRRKKTVTVDLLELLQRDE